MDDSKKMRRSYSDKIIGGVAGGLGDYFDIDPAIFRILFVAFTLVGGGGMLVYLLLWIFLKGQVASPNAKDTDEMELTDVDEEDNVIEPKKSGSMIGGGLLILLGLGLLFDDFFNWFDWEIMLPLALVILGVAIVAMNYKPSNKQ